MTTEETISPLAEGLAARLRSIALALDRLDRLESGTGDWRAAFPDGELPQAATELTLRAFHTASDASNYHILRHLAEGESTAVSALIEATEMGRLALSERLNDLVQVGLAARLIDTDHAQLTAAGAALYQLFDAVSQTVIENFRETEDGNS